MERHWKYLDGTHREKLILPHKRMGQGGSSGHEFFSILEREGKIPALPELLLSGSISLDWVERVLKKRNNDKTNLVWSYLSRNEKAIAFSDILANLDLPWCWDVVCRRGDFYMCREVETLCKDAWIYKCRSPLILERDGNIDMWNKYLGFYLTASSHLPHIRSELIDLVMRHKSERWCYEYVSSLADERDIERYPDFPWSAISLARGGRIPFSTVMNMECGPNLLRVFRAFKIGDRVSFGDIMECELFRNLCESDMSYPDNFPISREIMTLGWNFSTTFWRNMSIRFCREDFEFIMMNLHYPWNWTAISEYADFNTCIFVHPDLPWCREGIMQNESVPFSVFVDAKALDISKMYMARGEITWSDVASHPEISWDYFFLCANKHFLDNL
jgi:hypothetical protein